MQRKVNKTSACIKKKVTASVLLIKEVNPTLYEPQVVKPRNDLIYCCYLFPVITIYCSYIINLIRDAFSYPKHIRRKPGFEHFYFFFILNVEKICTLFRLLFIKSVDAQCNVSLNPRKDVDISSLHTWALSKCTCYTGVYTFRALPKRSEVCRLNDVCQFVHGLLKVGVTQFKGTAFVLNNNEYYILRVFKNSLLQIST